MRLILLHTFVSLFILFVYGRRFQYAVTYSKIGGQFELKWSIYNSRKIIKIQLCNKVKFFLNTPSWLGIGFSNRGELNNADLFAFNTKLSRGFDLHTDNNSKIKDDLVNNYQIVNFNEENDMICLTFERELETCDEYDYTIDRGTTNILIFSSFTESEVLTELYFHSLHPFVVLLQLIRSTIPVSNIPSSTPTIDVTVNEVEIPSTKTTYWCKVIELPHIVTKHHIIKYEAIITETSQGIIHHMELFHCQMIPHDSMKKYNAPCNSESKPMGLTSCRKVIAAWAMGADAFTYPEEVGNPIGGPFYSNYAILEIHYNNQYEKQGLIDYSGLRLYVTSHLKKFDAGIIELGLEYVSKNSIPPGQNSFVLSGHCTEQCTRQALSENGIFVFGSQLHTHLTGIKVETRHFRHNRELIPLNQDLHYQPHYQEIRLLPQLVNVLPGDRLVTSCTYKTTNKTDMTLGGIAIENEMCVNYVFYYPRMDLELCKSSVSDLALESFLNKPLNDLNKTFNTIQWSDKNTKQLELFYKSAPIHQSCNMSDSESFQGRWDSMELPYMKSENLNLNENFFHCLTKELLN